jgi:periplasmic mercuric ion binding protein
MKTFLMSFFFALFLGVFLNVEPAFSETNEPLPAVIETEFRVLGMCGMCKTRIERAAYSVRGVRNASWDQQKQMLTVSYRTSRADQETIERAIAKAGHDTENFLTSEETHANLHHCCVYPRDPEMLKNNRLYNQE